MKRLFRRYKYQMIGICTSLVLIAVFSCTKDASSKLVQEDSISKKPDSVTTPIVTNPSGKYSSITMDKFIGANGFHEDNIEWMQAVGSIRAYCNWDWFQGDNPNDQLIFQNSRGGWYFDDAFQKMKDANISTIMCFQGAVKNLHGTGNFKFNDKPINQPGLSTLDPKSYTVIANTLFQIAARYGKTKVADALLNVPADQKRSGLNLINYLEVWNEPDKDWEGADAQFSPEEYAAMLSTCYDRIKEADPTMKVAMAGLATLSVDYVKKMKAWVDKNRSDKKFPADVINVHIYAFNNQIVWGKTWPLFGPAESPEDGKLKEKSKELVDYCRSSIPGAEVWISEFGWDTNPQSILSPKPISGVSLQELQGRFLVRAYMAFAAAGIDQCQMFILADPSQNYIDTQFGTSGLLDRTLNFTKKTSWYYVSTMKTILKNMVLVSEETTTDPNILVYKFKDVSSDKGAYVIWSKTSSNAMINDYKLPLNKSATTATKVELMSNNAAGEKSALVINSNSVTVAVSEKPLFILVDNVN